MSQSMKNAPVDPLLEPLKRSKGAVRPWWCESSLKWALDRGWEVLMVRSRWLTSKWKHLLILRMEMKTLAVWVKGWLWACNRLEILMMMIWLITLKASQYLAKNWPKPSLRSSHARPSRSLRSQNQTKRQRKQMQSCRSKIRWCEWDSSHHPIFLHKLYFYRQLKTGEISLRCSNRAFSTCALGL